MIPPDSLEKLKSSRDAILRVLAITPLDEKANIMTTVTMLREMVKMHPKAITTAMMLVSVESAIDLIEQFERDGHL